MSLQLHELKGCSPVPLANYLKALGVLRLMVEQGADPEARGWWQHEHFRLLTKLTQEDMENFFLHRYAPSPLLSPWNKGCGFFKPGDAGLAPLEGSKAERFGRFRSGIAESRRLLDEQSEADAVIRAIKDRTKTNKSFQTDEQRERLKASVTFRGCVEDLRKQAGPADLPASRREEIAAAIAETEGIVTAAARPPTQLEADQLKQSPGYKKLLAAAGRRFKGLKDTTLIPDCRKNWRGGLAEWLAAAVVLDGDGSLVRPSLLGSGGNDGNLDFTNTFMQRLGELFIMTSEEGRPSAGAGELLANALWATPTNRLVRAAVGQFQPGAAGGANSSNGAMGDSQVNPWDFVLMMEGAVLFSARATRRLDPNSFARAAAPFAVRGHAAGYGSSGGDKLKRGEQWLPLWGRPATLGEVAALFGEARVQLGRQTANRPVDVARAISRLGVARGVYSFARYGYLERNGQSTLAVPLGRMDVREAPRGHLIDDLAPWMDWLRRLARGKHAPNRLVQAERQLADAVMAALTHDDTSERWQAILLAAVGVERLQAAGCGFEAGPIPALSPDWVAAAGDGIEVRLAMALGSAAAGYTRAQRALDPVRHHWLPLESGARRFRVSDKRVSHKRLAKDSRVVMMGRDAVADCAAVVERRMIEAAMKGQRRLPLVAAPGCGARLEDLMALLAGSVDFGRVLDLARALMAARWDEWAGAPRDNAVSAAEMPPEGWLALRLTCLPWPLPPDRKIPAEAGIVRRLLAGDSAGAVSVALARLRSAGIRPPLQAGVTDGQSARLWAAALVFPIDSSTALRAAAVLDPKLKGFRDA
ncbi:MAG: type I-U CRISPR-associated protein Csx17 [Bryobacterales bacterium]|nr:type I-U CRISPR-associated protein Csx17 [Bryobacterales bacterium]